MAIRDSDNGRSENYFGKVGNVSKKGTEITLTQQLIESKIFTIRGVQVVLDKDLAAFYEVKPIRLREQIKRNANRFPDDFVFRLTEDEVNILVSQNAIPSKRSLGGYMPFAFSKMDKASLKIIKKLGV